MITTLFSPLSMKHFSDVGNLFWEQVEDKDTDGESQVPESVERLRERVKNADGKCACNEAGFWKVGMMVEQGS